jgi:hypothetical protein
MQEAADTIMGETFDFPGVASQAMLPPQPLRAYSQGQRTSSIGQPLQLMDSNQSVLPYTGKGKGRARDFDPVQQQQFPTGWDPATVADFGQLSVPYVEDVQPLPQQLQNIDPGTFTFTQEDLTSWQPLYPDYAQSNVQQAHFNPLALDFQPDQPQPHFHGHPHPVQAGRPDPPLQQPPSQNPWQQVEQFYPSTQPPPPQQEQHWLDRPPGATNAQPSDAQPSNPQPSNTQPTNPRPTNPQPTNPRPRNPRPRNPRPSNPQPSNPQPTNPQQQQPFRVGVGYRFRPGLGFVCQECGTVLQQPNMHFLVDDHGRGHWCEALGTEMAEQVNIMEDARRRRGGDVV